MPPDVEQLITILEKSSRLPEKGFSEPEIDLLSKYYHLVLKWNKRIHLTTLTHPQEFFERHILESSFSESLILPSVSQLWDLGSGLGVPGIVIAILRPDLTVNLVEISRNKTLFLEEASAHLGMNNVRVIESSFETVERIPADSCLTVRAIEGMGKIIPEIIRSGAEATQIMIFGAKDLEEKARGHLSAQHRMESFLIPGSKRRYVINISRST